MIAGRLLKEIAIIIFRLIQQSFHQEWLLLVTNCTTGDSNSEYFQLPEQNLANQEQEV
jgi:hypothetical protein